MLASSEVDKVKLENPALADIRILVPQMRSMNVALGKKLLELKEETSKLKRLCISEHYDKTVAESLGLMLPAWATAVVNLDQWMDTLRDCIALCETIDGSEKDLSEHLKKAHQNLQVSEAHVEGAKTVLKKMKSFQM